MIKLPIGDFGFGFGNFWIGDWSFRIGDWEEISSQSPIQNHQLVIVSLTGDFHFKYPITLRV